jgi:hypothetical protein
MKRAMLRTEPVSTHLQRHRDCLKRRRAERRGPSAAAGDRDNVPEWSALAWPGRRRATLPFGRHDDGE